MPEAAYVATIHEEDGALGVSFPDFPGCVTTASDMTSAIERGAQALAFHAEGMIADGEPLPEPRSVERLRNDEPEWIEGALLALIPLEVPGRRSGSASRATRSRSPAMRRPPHSPGGPVRDLRGAPRASESRRWAERPRPH